MMVGGLGVVLDFRLASVEPLSAVVLDSVFTTRVGSCWAFPSDDEISLFTGAAASTFTPSVVSTCDLLGFF